MTPTRRTVAIALALAFVALVVPTAAVLAIGGVVAACVLADVVLARRGLALHRAVPPLAIIGRPIAFSVDAGERSPADVVLRQPRTADLRVEPAEARRRLDGTIIALRRGRHELPAVAARLRGPLGLAAWDYRGDGNAVITVHPDVPNARRVAHLVRTGRFSDSGGVTRGQLGLGTEFESIRDYLPDDDVRQINWAATQRMGRPMSNQYRVEADRQVLCLLDCGRLMQAPVRDFGESAAVATTRLDAAIDAVTMVVHVADALGDRSGVVAFDREVRRSIADRRRGAQHVVDAIYDLEPSPIESDYELAFRSVRNTKRALVFVFSDLLDAAAARSLVEAIPVLTRRHAVVVASVADPDVRDALDARPHTSVDAYRATAALDMQDARARVATALAGARATVVDAAPDRLGEACVTAYLKLKDSARL
jgi:uncharacterized protein (DUF58 family)